MQKLPRSRSADIVIQNLGKEILVYDLLTHQAFCLNETSAIVYSACDGETTFRELKQKHHLTDDLIFFALEQLQKDNLVEVAAITHFEGLSRRDVIRRVGLASMVALPIISSLVAPTAAHAASGTVVAPCTGSRPDGSFVSTTATGNNDTAAQAACLSNLNCQCASGNADGSVSICAGAPSLRACSCNGTCAPNCVNPGGRPSGSSVSTTATGSSDSAAQAACLSNLNSQCCSGNADGSVSICAGAPSLRACSCNGTCD